MANNPLEGIAEADTELVESSDCTVEETAVESSDCTVEETAVESSDCNVEEKAVESSDCNAEEKTAVESSDCTVVVEETAFRGENCCVLRHIRVMWPHADMMQAVLGVVLGVVLGDQVEVLGSVEHYTKFPDS